MRIHQIFCKSHCAFPDCSIQASVSKSNEGCQRQPDAVLRDLHQQKSTLLQKQKDNTAARMTATPGAHPVHHDFCEISVIQHFDPWSIPRYFLQIHYAMISSLVRQILISRILGCLRHPDINEIRDVGRIRSTGLCQKQTTEKLIVSPFHSLLQMLLHTIRILRGSAGVPLIASIVTRRAFSLIFYLMVKEAAYPGSGLQHRIFTHNRHQA